MSTNLISNAELSLHRCCVQHEREIVAYSNYWYIQSSRYWVVQSYYFINLLTYFR